MASASESGEGAASCDLAGSASSCSSMKSGAPGDATWRRLALVIVTNSAGLVLVRQKRPACGARGMRAASRASALWDKLVGVRGGKDGTSHLVCLASEILPSCAGHRHYRK